MYPWVFLLLISIPWANQSLAQTAANEPFTPALQVDALYAAAKKTHPLLLGARLEAQSGIIDIEAVERQRWPTLSAVVESNTGNTSDLAPGIRIP